MKKSSALLFIAVMLLILAACGGTANNNHHIETSKSAVVAKTDPTPDIESNTNTEPSAEKNEEDDDMTNITITVDNTVFSAKIYDNETARALLSHFPMTLNMSELNGNEKYFYLSDSLPANSQRVGNINAGDLMLYGSDCLVLFYESFSSSYSYTKLGYIEELSGLTDALGSGNAEVVFTLGEDRLTGDE